MRAIGFDGFVLLSDGRFLRPQGRAEFQATWNASANLRVLCPSEREFSMRSLMVTALALIASSVSAETWVVREGKCGEWQSRWDIEQDRSGVWVGTIDHFQIGGPCAPRTGQVRRSDVRAVIAGENFFAFNAIDNGSLCSYVARIVRENRARGVSLCEGNPEPGGFVIRFRSQQDTRPMRDPDDELLTEEQRRQPDLRFEFRGLEQLFGR
jgi:hypothetical protein